MDDGFGASIQAAWDPGRKGASGAVKTIGRIGGGLEAGGCDAEAHAGAVSEVGV